MIRKALTIAIAALAILYVFVIPSEPEALKLVFKLLPMALILTQACLLGLPSRQSKHWLLLLGLLFCMAGDGLLRWFVVGLAAFLAGHLLYIASFLSRWRFSWPRAAALLPIAAYALYMGHRLVLALQESDQGSLIAPVIVYVAAISLMAWTAIMTGHKHAAAGSLLFLVSDSVLAWNKFIADVAHSGVWIMTTYYAAQWLIACSLREPFAPPLAPTPPASKKTAGTDA